MRKQFTKEELFKLYIEQDLSTTIIGNMLGISSHYVSVLLRKYEIPTRPFSMKGRKNKGKSETEPWNKGKSTSDETKKKISEAKIGSEPWNKGVKTGLVPKTAFKKGDNKKEKHHLWMDDEASYSAKHSWILRNWGEASCCKNNFCEGLSNNFEWANISRKYVRSDKRDWTQLCVSCHRRFDLSPNYKIEVEGSLYG